MHAYRWRGDRAPAYLVALAAALAPFGVMFALLMKPAVLLVAIPLCIIIVQWIGSATSRIRISPLGDVVELGSACGRAIVASTDVWQIAVTRRPGGRGPDVVVWTMLSRSGERLGSLSMIAKPGALDEPSRRLRQIGVPVVTIRTTSEARALGPGMPFFDRHPVVSTLLWLLLAAVLTVMWIVIVMPIVV